VMWYEKHAGVNSTMKTKARKYNKLKLIKNLNENEWIVQKMDGYNKTDYIVRMINGKYTCTCQGFTNNNTCSHVLAVKLFQECHDEKNKGR